MLRESDGEGEGEALPNCEMDATCDVEIDTDTEGEIDTVLLRKGVDNCENDINAGDNVIDCDCVKYCDAVDVRESVDENEIIARTLSVIDAVVDVLCV